MVETQKYIGEKDYKSGKYKMPNRASQKDDKFYLKMAKYMWSQYVSNSSAISYGGYSSTSGKSFVELRLYALGQQDKLRYMELLDDCDEFTQEGYLNLNWDIVQILPKFTDIVKGKLAGMDFEMNTQAIDAVSNKKRLRKSNKMKILANPQMQEFMKKTGFRPKGMKLPSYIKSVEDVEVYVKMGGVKLEYEMAMRDAIESTKYESRWDTLKDKIVEDVITLGICAIKTKCHEKTHKVIADYVDPLYLVIQPSKYADYRDSTWAAEIRTVTIGQLRMESNLTEGDILEIVKKYRGQRGNSKTYDVPTGIEWEKSYQNDYDFDTTQISYNDFTIDVMESYFIAKDVERYIVGVREDEGNYIYDKVKRNAKLNKKQKKSGKNTEDNIIQKCYKCFWVIGTDYLYDCGEEYAIAKAEKDGVKEALLPIQVYSNKTKSIVERCISFVDDIQLATLKKRNALSKMAPGPRMIIDKSILRDSVDIGGQQYSMLDLLSVYSKSGVMIVESRPEYEGDEGASNRRPFDFMPSGVMEDINIFLQEISHNVDLIRQVTGINEVADGSTQKQDMLVKVMEGLNAATNNALRPHFRLYEGLYENWCKYACLKWQTALMGGDIDVNYVPMGDTMIQTIKLSKDMYLYDYGIHITLIPSQEDRQMLLQNIQQMRIADQLAIEDYLVLHNMIKTGDIKKAQLFLAKAVKEYRKLQHQRQLEQMDAQGKANGEAAVMAEQARAQTSQIKLQGDLAKIAAQGEEDRKTIAFQAKFDMTRDEEKDTRKLGSDVVQKGMDAAIEGKIPPPPTGEEMPPGQEQMPPNLGMS